MSYQHVLYVGQDNDLHELRFDGIWHDSDLTLLAGARPPRSRSPLTGYWEPSGADGRSVGGYLRVTFVDSDGQLCELRYDRTRWESRPISLQPTSAQGNPGSPLTSLLGGTPRRESLFHFGKDGHVRALWSDGHDWHSNDLNQLAAQAIAPSMSPLMSPLTGFRDVPSSHGGGGTQHLFYLGTDAHVHELLSDGRSWRSNDLSAAAGAPIRPAMSARMMSPLTSHYGAENRRENVFYIGSEGHVHELWSDGHGWHSSDLSQAAGDADEPTLRPMSPLTSYGWPEDGTEHVFYVGASGDLWELWYDGSWHSTDLTEAVRGADAPALRPMSSLTGYSWSEDGTQHVFYVGASGDLWELWFDGTWHSADLTKAA